MLTVTIENRQVGEALSRLLGRLDDLSPAMASVGQELESRVSGRFETEADPFGLPWAPWAAATLESYPANGNRRILDRYGDMLLSLNSQSTATSVTVGFGQSYAAYHEWGTEHMPRRGLLLGDPDVGTLAPDDERAVLDILGLFFSPT